MKQQLTERKLALTAMNKFDEMKKTDREKQKSLGKKAYFIKNSVKKELLNEERYFKFLLYFLLFALSFLCSFFFLSDLNI
jgi:hypothetical protein